MILEIATNYPGARKITNLSKHYIITVKYSIQYAMR